MPLLKPNHRQIAAAKAIDGKRTRYMIEGVQGLIRDVAEDKGAPIAYQVLLTKMYPLRTRVTDFVYQELVRHGLPFFRTVLVERAAYREMFLTGTPPSASDAGGAGAEIGALVAEIEAVLKERDTKASPPLGGAGG